MVRGRPRTKINANNRETVPPTIDAQAEANHMQTLLQGLERVARIAMEAEQRRHREVDPFFQLYCSFNSLHPPTFDGTGDFAVAENWIANIKDKFQILRAPEENRVELATQLFEGHARFWWQETKRQTIGPVNWVEFERLFEGRYMDIRSRELHRQKFTSLKQGIDRVTEYNSKFENLMRYAPDIVQDEFRLRQQYLSGLNPRLAQLIDIPGVDKLPDLMLRATTADAYETHFSQPSGVRNIRLRMEDTPMSTPIRYNNMGSRTNFCPNEKPWCNHCHKPHLKEQCSYANRLCHICLKSGHFARECPYKPPQSNIIPNRGTMRLRTTNRSNYTRVTTPEFHQQEFN